jgi:hypothetical protein
MTRPMNNDDLPMRRKLRAHCPRIAKAAASVLVFAALMCASQPAAAQFVQQGPKLVGTGWSGSPDQGWSVSVSSDGNTLAVGGYKDNGGAGATWVFTRNDSGLWTQQGPKLVGSGATGNAQQGNAVALSGDGNTLIVAGNVDAATSVGGGAVWFFTRSGGVWAQQGSKITVSGEGAAQFGWSVALSADGNTAIVGAPFYNGNDPYGGLGAAYVYTRNGATWTLQAQLTGSGYTGSSLQGTSVALSADGNTALVGGGGDGGENRQYNNGAVWIFTRSGVTWTQVGSKLYGTGASNAAQGAAGALSADGKTAIVGGPNAGVVWIFANSNGSWVQQGSKLAATGLAPAGQGQSVALSANGNLALVGAPNPGNGIGGASIFARTNGVWGQGELLTVFSGRSNNAASQGYAVALSAAGNTAIVGGPGDNPAGATWAFFAADAAFTATPTSGKAPLAVTFKVSGLTLPVTDTLNFGDGTQGALSQIKCVIVPPDRVGGGGGRIECSGSASHIYNNVGTYTAALLNASGETLGAVTIIVSDNPVTHPGGGTPLLHP